MTEQYKNQQQKCVWWYGMIGSQMLFLRVHVRAACLHSPLTVGIVCLMMVNNQLRSAEETVIFTLNTFPWDMNILWFSMDINAWEGYTYPLQYLLSTNRKIAWEVPYQAPRDSDTGFHRWQIPAEECLCFNLLKLRVMTNPCWKEIAEESCKHVGYFSISYNPKCVDFSKQIGCCRMFQLHY